MNVILNQWKELVGTELVDDHVEAFLRYMKNDRMDSQSIQSPTYKIFRDQWNFENSNRRKDDFWGLFHLYVLEIQLQYISLTATGTDAVDAFNAVCPAAVGWLPIQKEACAIAMRNVNYFYDFSKVTGKDDFEQTLVIPNHFSTTGSSMENDLYRSLIDQLCSLRIPDATSKPSIQHLLSLVFPRLGYMAPKEQELAEENSFFSSEEWYQKTQQELEEAKVSAPTTQNRLLICQAAISALLRSAYLGPVPIHIEEDLLNPKIKSFERIRNFLRKDVSDNEIRTIIGQCTQDLPTKRMDLQDMQLSDDWDTLVTKIRTGLKWIEFTRFWYESLLICFPLTEQQAKQELNKRIEDSDHKFDESFTTYYADKQILSNRRTMYKVYCKLWQMKRDIRELWASNKKEYSYESLCKNRNATLKWDYDAYLASEVLEEVFHRLMLADLIAPQTPIEFKEYDEDFPTIERQWQIRFGEVYQIQEDDINILKTFFSAKIKDQYDYVVAQKNSFAFPDIRATIQKAQTSSLFWVHFWAAVAFMKWKTMQSDESKIIANLHKALKETMDFPMWITCLGAVSILGEKGWTRERFFATFPSAPSCWGHGVWGWNEVEARMEDRLAASNLPDRWIQQYLQNGPPVSEERLKKFENQVDMKVEHVEKNPSEERMTLLNQVLQHRNAREDAVLRPWVWEFIKTLFQLDARYDIDAMHWIETCPIEHCRALVLEDEPFDLKKKRLEELFCLRTS